jgi:hypothetical protein
LQVVAANCFIRQKDWLIQTFDPKSIYNKNAFLPAFWYLVINKAVGLIIP